MDGLVCRCVRSQTDRDSIELNVVTVHVGFRMIAHSLLLWTMWGRTRSLWHSGRYQEVWASASQWVTHTNQSNKSDFHVKSSFGVKNYCVFWWSTQFQMLSTITRITFLGEKMNHVSVFSIKIINFTNVEHGDYTTYSFNPKAVVLASACKTLYPSN